MSSQASTSTSAMDVEPAANSPMTPGTPGNDETDHDEHPRKRRRASKKPRRMAGFLSGIVHVPMDIFAQITSHLYPIDIHALARTSKKFRMLLMNRSSRHIWLAAERNVPGLPPCPEHITSPEYAALVFGRWCSMCATTANVPRRMDEMLAVKLCSNCREKNIVGISFIARSVLPFVRLSHAVKQPTNNNRAYGLMNEVDWVVSIVFDLAARGETATLEKWKIERVAQLKKQAEFSRALVPFLDAMEDQRDDEIEELKAKRFAAIKEKLLESGWEEIDCQITHFPVLREWEKIVGVPKQLTNRTWENIKPKLEPILRANKQARLARERKERKQARKSRLCKLASDIGQAEAQVIALAEHPEESLVVPFPKDSQVLKLWSVRNILKQDVSGDVAEENFMAAREEVKTQIKSWQRSVMGQLARSLKPSGLSGLLALSIRRRHSLEPPAGLSTEFTPESEPHLQDPDLRKLLRADSVFQFGNGANTECLFFPDVVEIAQRELLVQQQQNRHYAYSDSDDENYRLEIEGYEYGYDRPAGLDLSRVSGHSYGIRVAKVLLACLGKPDATYLEMKSLGKRFICGRCWVRSPMTWVEMLAHWSQFATYHWPYSTETSLQQRGITCKEEHKISEPDYMQSTVEPESNDDDITLEDGARRHLIRLMTDEDIQAIENDGSPQFVCAVCDMVSGMHDGHGLGGKPIPKPKGTKEIIFGHLADVHSIPEEKWEKMAIAST